MPKIAGKKVNLHFIIQKYYSSFLSEATGDLLNSHMWLWSCVTAFVFLKCCCCLKNPQ